MTAFDLSGLLRQGGLLAYAHPIIAAKVAKDMLKAFVSEQEAFNTIEKMKNSALWQFSQNVGLEITTNDRGLNSQEEVLQGRWAEMIPGIANSERAYITVLNGLRFGLFEQMVDKLGKGGEVTVGEGKMIAKYINTATGRGDFGSIPIIGKTLKSYSKLLSLVFFAPRYVWSRVEYAIRAGGLLLPGGSKRVKVALAKEYARSLAGSALMTALTMAFGHWWADDEDEEPTLELDPRSADFMKVKIGESRIDVWSGMLQPTVYITRFLRGEYMNSQGEIKSLTHEDGKKGPYDKTRWDLTLAFMRTKASPAFGAAITASNDMTDVVGKKHTPTSLVVGLFTPLSLKDIIENMKEHGFSQGSAMSVLSLMGAGIQTYGPRTEYKDAKPEKQKELFQKALKRVKWDDKPLPYADMLAPKQIKEYELAKENHAGRKLATLTDAEPIRDKKYSKDWGMKADEKFKEKHDKWQKSRDKALEELKGFSDEEKLKTFEIYWHRQKDEGGKGGIYSDSYWARYKRLKKMIGK